MDPPNPSPKSKRIAVYLAVTLVAFPYKYPSSLKLFSKTHSSRDQVILSENDSNYTSKSYSNSSPCSLYFYIRAFNQLHTLFRFNLFEPILFVMKTFQRKILGEYLNGADDTKGKELVLYNGHKTQAVDRSRTCSECGMRFRNGQALGGHISIHFQRHLGPKNNKKFKVKQQQLLLEYPSWNNSRLSCQVCNKTFPSMKSLCGHMGSHRQRAQSPPPSSSLSSADQYSDGDSYIDSASKHYKYPKSKKRKFLDGYKGHHVCPICFKTFPTGQALGGHKRSHYYKGEPVLKATGAAKNKVASTDGHEDSAKIKVASADDREDCVIIDPGSQFWTDKTIHVASRRILLDLDLNKPPKEDDDVSN